MKTQFQFHGFAGAELKYEISRFCKFQPQAISKLEAERRSNEKLQAVLSTIEMNDSCHSLKLEHLFPSVWQRFTKYPLLLKSLYEATAIVLSNNQKEVKAVREAWIASKKILDFVNENMETIESCER